jgi:D-serine deaminase-like pyridoxal phosphate-dependent protein
MQLTALETPALVLDRSKLDHNLERMSVHIRGLGGVLRPHVKTAKSIDVVRRALRDTPGGITVSTLKEAEYFLAHGIRDIIYAVGIAPAKFAHVFALLRGGAGLKVIADSAAAVKQLAEAARAANLRVPVLIELDVDGHRSGVSPESQLLLDLGRALTSTTGVALPRRRCARAVCRARTGRRSRRRTAPACRGI